MGEVERLWVFAGAILTLGLGLAFGNVVLGTAVGVYATGIAVWAAEATGRSLRRLEEVGTASHIARVIDVVWPLLLDLIDPDDSIERDAAGRYLQSLLAPLATAEKVVPLPRCNELQAALVKYVAGSSWDDLEIRNATLRALTELWDLMNRRTTGHGSTTGQQTPPW